MSAEPERPVDPQELMGNVWAPSGAPGRPVAGRDPVAGGPSPKARAAGADRRVGFGLRLLALIIDTMVVGVLSVVVGPVVGGLLGAAALGVIGGAAGATGSETAALAGFGALLGMFAGFVIAAFVLGTLYFLLEGFTGWTLGKLALGLRIRSADGTPAPIGRLLGRYAIKNNAFLLGLLGSISGMALLVTLSSLGGLVVFIGCFLTLGAARQALHDRITGTAVFRRADVAG